jgi:hypothetical protein
VNGYRRKSTPICDFFLALENTELNLLSTVTLFLCFLSVRKRGSDLRRVNRASGIMVAAKRQAQQENAKSAQILASGAS